MEEIQLPFSRQISYNSVQMSGAVSRIQIDMFIDYILLPKRQALKPDVILIQNLDNSIYSIDNNDVMPI